MLVVDLQLAEGSKGYDIISAIRACSYVNDILFYSAAGVSVLEEEMKNIDWREYFYRIVTIESLWERFKS